MDKDYISVISYLGKTPIYFANFEMNIYRFFNNTNGFKS